MGVIVFRRLAMVHLFCLASSIGYAAASSTVRTVPKLAEKIAQFEKKIHDGYGNIFIAYDEISHQVVKIRVTHDLLVFTLEKVPSIAFEVFKVRLSQDLESPSITFNQNCVLTFTDSDKKAEFLHDLRALFRLYRSQPEKETGFMAWMREKFGCFCPGGGCE